MTRNKKAILQSTKHHLLAHWSAAYDFVGIEMWWQKFGTYQTLLHTWFQPICTVDSSQYSLFTTCIVFVHKKRWAFIWHILYWGFKENNRIFKFILHSWMFKYLQLMLKKIQVKPLSFNAWPCTYYGDVFFNIKWW